MRPGSGDKIREDLNEVVTFEAMRIVQEWKEKALKCRVCGEKLDALIGLCEAHVKELEEFLKSKGAEGETK